MGARSQLGWLIRGGSATNATLQALSTDLRELQQKVVGLEASLQEMQRNHVRMNERQLDDYDRIRTAVGQATDDLVARVAAVDERVRGNS
ncbi:MAG: hypothetical protein JWN99_567 [Ilumatobacteraceae bacterium]|nr:hypothetical protein [Ilumatobacteraceae bacterium]